MADGTKIEWATASWNPIRARHAVNGRIGWHCEVLTPGCENCYAQAINRRLGTGREYLKRERTNNDLVQVFLDKEILIQPLRWRRPRRIFACSMTDLFGEWVADEMIDRIFAAMGACEDAGLGHQFQVLTKRAGRMRDYMRSDAACKAWNSRRLDREAWPPRNIWAGVSVEDQRRADERIPLLLDTPAAVRWVSYEPALEAVDFDRWFWMYSEYGGNRRMPAGGWDHPQPIGWVVVGGERGPGARPFNIEWARSIIRQCKAAGVPVFIKQVGANAWDGKIPHPGFSDRKGGDPAEWPDEDLHVREYPMMSPRKS